MTFRELLIKYKDGTLTDEEKLLVEQEIEKSEAINDYLADEIEKSLGLENGMNYEISEDNYTKDNEKITRAIKKTVNRRLTTVVGASVACVIVIILVIQHIISPLVSSQYYDPTKKTAGQEYQQDLSFDLRGITEVSMPGYAMRSIYYAENLGFGKYNLIYTRKNLFTKEEVTVNAKIDRNIRVGTPESFYPRTYTAFVEFWNYEEGTDKYEESLQIEKNLSEQDIEHIRELPSTSYISAWARFSKDLNMEELNEVMVEYNKLDVKWIAVRTAEKQEQQLMGFSTGLNDGFHSETVDEEKYPGFQLVDAMQLKTGGKSYEELMAGRYEMHFTSLLKYLVEHHDAVSALVGNSKAYDYESALDYVEKNGIRAYGALIYGEADDLLELYESETIMTFDIDNVIASKYIQ